MSADAQAPKVIAIEEHFMHPALADHFGKAAHGPGPISDRLFDYTDLRLREMDAAGVDMAVLSHQSPGSQRLADDIAVTACRAVNDALAGIIAAAPDRFAGFAMIPTEQPQAAADELARAVEELGLKGAMIHGLSHGNFVDLEAYRPIFARAAALDVPVYIHPALPDREVMARYYAPYTDSHPMIARAAWGFGVEAGTQAVRLILSGLFDDHPDLKILLGHLGEAIPFWLDRIDASFARPGNAPSDFAEVFRRNFWVTTSGFFSDRALSCTIDAMGVDRVLFAVDWPYADNAEAVDWLNAAPIPDGDRAAIFSGNATALLRL
ncbi:MAG: 2,3-dihydroxybenzoate decarboxylase [Rhodobacteraceae bacterium HLUCCA08]|nr:MAG: 2,3-dihydroxybenzoate decarboxylase [Rhodobacteraceae bacterium HLUCCA08]